VRGVIRDPGGFDVSIVQTARDAIAEVDRSVPDVTLMDIGLPDQSGLVAGRTILERHPDAKVVALTALMDRGAVDEALRIGFIGYLSKDTPLSQFMNAIQSVLDGHMVLPKNLSPIRRRTDGDHHVAMLAEQLTSREREVLALLVQGIDGREAASALGISPNTLRTHFQSIFAKLQVHSRLEAAAFAIRHQLVPAPVAGAPTVNGHRRGTAGTAHSS
jgi:DNA-binding NarL/FixJ family response regulator